VNAKDLGTGKEQKITITASSGLSKDEVEKMRQDAESHAEDDKKRREEVEVRNEADNAVYRSEKMLKDSGDKISAGDKSKIEAAMNGVKEALKGTDTAAIKGASEKLNEAWQAASAELYKQAQQAQGGPGGAGAGPMPGTGGPGAGASGGAGPGAGGQGAQGGSKDEGPIIDAEVVDDNKR
jgi:molecular chaperone DnaK